ncbi:hypothetical protein ACFO5O_14420 [Geojedonia litorea]|uniref:GLPGLI family protein n=1 Tax=Geojedonia litorea TaxID=1268269 RepID=A0ABV9N5D2_9FLAO
MNTLKSLYLCLLLLLLAPISAVGQKMNNGSVIFTVSSDDEITGAMLNFVITNYFNQEHSTLVINMMGGMMIVKRIFSYTNKHSNSMYIDLLGEKYEITDANEDNDVDVLFIRFQDVETIKYDKKDSKTILGYKCYRANITYKDGNSSVFYITNKLNPKSLQVKDNGLKLEGYPLEMTIYNPETTIIIKAKEVSDYLPNDSFQKPVGYSRITSAEFEQRMAEKK